MGGAHLSRKRFEENAIHELEAICGAELVVPTYRYDFPKIKIFEPDTMSSDLGAISNIVIRSEGWRREPTPIFSHSSRHATLPLLHHPFGETSVFSSLRNNGGRIMFLGVGMESMTFLHHVEHMAAIPYRYPKIFDGLVRREGLNQSHWINIHVRPLGGVVDYDFAKIASHLFRCGILREVDSRVFEVLASEVYDEMYGLLAGDPLWLLTKISRHEVLSNLDRIGRPFNKSDFE